MRCVAALQLVRVFAHAHIPYILHPVLDRPVPPPIAVAFQRCRCRWDHAREPIRHSLVDFPRFQCDPRARPPQHVLDARPRAGGVEVSAPGQVAGRQPPMPFADRRRLPPGRLARQRRGGAKPGQVLRALAVIACADQQLLPALRQDLLGQRGVSHACVPWHHDPTHVAPGQQGRHCPACMVVGATAVCARTRPLPCSTRLTSASLCPCAPTLRSYLPSIAWPGSGAPAGGGALGGGALRARCASRASMST